MKKLFFTALVAVAAVGGAIAAGPFYAPGSSTQLFCNGEGGICSSLHGINQVYLEPANPGPQTNIDFLEDYTYQP